MTYAEERWIERFNRRMAEQGDPLQVVQVGRDLLYVVQNEYGSTTYHLTLGSYLCWMRQEGEASSRDQAG